MNERVSCEGCGAVAEIKKGMIPRRESALRILGFEKKGDHWYCGGCTGKKGKSKWGWVNKRNFKR